MMLLEHDAKVLLEEARIPVPRGVLAGAATAQLAPRPPYVVKAQVPVGGRGRLGGIARARSDVELSTALQRLLGTTIKGHPVRECRVEKTVEGAECYLGLCLDPVRGRLTILLAAHGGVDIEAHSHRQGVLSADSEFNVHAAVRTASALAGALPDSIRDAIGDAVTRLIPVFFNLEATLLEINPLFVQQRGTWVAGDAKLVVDENSFARQPRLSRLIRDRAEAYPQSAIKQAAGFDFVVIDQGGFIGLVTTGAGLSMQIVDELKDKGLRPYNFCDIRTGQFRGSPDRLIDVLQRIAKGPSVRSVLMNFFAGITDLGELAHLLLAAVEAVPELRAPITARLIGNGAGEASRILATANHPLRVETDLERAISAVIASDCGVRR